MEKRARLGDVAAQLLLADALDQAGRHSEAIDWLARASRDKQPEALWKLGRRLFIGDKAPHLPSQAIGLLKDAALHGATDAALLLAVLAAAGIHRPRSWDDAFDWLALAGRQGAGVARELLRFIPDRESMDDWLKPAQGRQIHDAPRLFAFEGVVDPAVCDWLMHVSKDRLGPAHVFESASGRTIESDLRKNSVAKFGLFDTNVLNVLIQAKIAATIGLPFDNLEAFSVLHYAVGQEAVEHADYIDPSAVGAVEQIASFGQRIATALLYLNDDYTGGETAFPQLGIAHRGKAGDLLVFFGTDEQSVPDPRSIHAGRPPRSGEKWVLSQFIRDRRMIPG